MGMGMMTKEEKYRKALERILAIANDRSERIGWRLDDIREEAKDALQP